MLIDQHQAHLTYCSNIHSGESWDDTFDNLQKYTTQIRDKLTHESFGIGLRLSNQASIELLEKNSLKEFKNWLDTENMYVFTVNGFPYGGFHDEVVKDLVHAPDWTTRDRLEYTKRLFDILAFLLPEGMDGGVSTSPISYKFWHNDENDLELAKIKATEHLAELILHLSALKNSSGKSLHLDMEPEPDGILETSTEFVSFFQQHLLKTGKDLIQSKLDIGDDQAEMLIREHFQLCYDVCHFAVGFEKPDAAISNILNANVKIGRIQISAALGSGAIDSLSDESLIKEKLKAFDEPTYLHQAVIRTNDHELKRCQDLGEALGCLDSEKHSEIRTHFHVPVFTEKYETLVSTQQDIIDTLKVWRKHKFTNHLEVETYTWGVLPENMRIDIVSSIIRELKWVKKTLS